jgi:arylsulfatase A-like enzyme
MKRRDFLKTTCVGVSALTFSSCATPSKRKPNIIYILADDLGYGDLGCFGQQRIKTPNIDKMCAEGQKFTQHYAGSTVCAPSRCVLMTGLHTGHAYIRGNSKNSMRQQDVTIAEKLKAAGYTNGLLGKWGLGQEGSDGVPTKKGFDYFFGYLDQSMAHNYYPHFLVRNEERVPLKNVVPKPGPHNQGVATEKVEYSHDLVAEESLQFIEKNKNRPFFLYLALTIPHANNEGREKGMEVPGYGEYADMDWPEAQKGHAAMISRMDKDIGRLMDKLKELGLDEDTFVFFTSDNGPHREGGNDPDFNNSNGPLRGLKRDLYEGGIRVPTIARWPGQIKAGTSSDLISAFWDFFPTACNIAGVETPSGLDGLSMLPTMLGKETSQEKHEYLYWEFHERNKKIGVRFGDWKVIKFVNDGHVEAYNLKDDLAEQNDVAAEKPEIMEKGLAYMKTARTTSEIDIWEF